MKLKCVQSFIANDICKLTSCAIHMYLDSNLIFDQDVKVRHCHGRRQNIFAAVDYILGRVKENCLLLPFVLAEPTLKCDAMMLWEFVVA